MIPDLWKGDLIKGAGNSSSVSTLNCTSLNYLGIPNGPLCVNADASQRSCNYAMTVDVALNQVSTVPEPSSLAMLGLARLA